MKPIILCGCETLILARKMASTLMTWERKIWRKIYGPKCEQGDWKIRNNL
jgi:hypothetical protein